MTYRGSTHDYLLENALPALPKRKEDRLIKKAQKGDEKARETVIRANMPAVIYVTKKYVPMHSHIWDDCLSAGLAGLSIAVMRYDPKKMYTGTKFLTYAQWWIMQRVRAELTDMIAAVRFPRGNRRKGVPSNTKMALAAHTVYWQESRDDDEDANRYECLAVRTAAGEAVEQPEPDDTPTLLKMLERRLTPREYLIITAYYGLAGKAWTLDELGQELGLSRERIRQVKETALEKLRSRQWREESGFGLHAEAVGYA